MKRILTILAGCCISATVANAQTEQFPWFAIPTNPTTSSGTLPSGSADFQYPAQPAQAVPAIKPIPLPPVEFDHAYGGQLVVTKFNDYSLIRMICKDTPRRCLLV